MRADPRAAPVRLGCAILSISSRSERPDTSGDYLAAALQAAGHELRARARCPDERFQIRYHLSGWLIAPEVQVIITNGGTGFGRGKSTVAAVSPLLDQVVPGFGELFRHISWLEIGSSALQSEALCGLANGRLVVCLPGAPDACELAWENILRAQLDSHQLPCNFATGLGRA